MCKVCKKPCHASIAPSRIVKTDQHQRNQFKLQWLKKYQGGVFDLLEQAKLI